MIAVLFKDVRYGQVFMYSGIAYTRVRDYKTFYGTFNAQEVDRPDIGKYFADHTVVYVLS